MEAGMATQNSKATVSDTDGMLPAAEIFVTRVRSLFEEGRDEEDIWSTACEYLRELLDDEQLKTHADTWPDSLSVEGKPGNLLFYEDPDYGFVLNALIKAPGLKTSVHDHGKSWTLYGVLEGGETVVRFDRIDDGPQVPGRAEVREAGAHDVVPGYIDFVPPWEIHQEHNTDQRTIGFIVRSQRSGTFVQNRFNPETGAVDQYDGPVQMPYKLG
jgi:predicted metal-dependent enzyme (double-stranded beta helix superfamily)